jgi:hypothetical protein
MNTKLKIGLGVSALFIGVPIAITAIGTINTVASAPARVVNKTLETNNIIENYEGFFVRKAEYDSRLAQITEHGKIMADNTDPAEAARLRVELAAMRQSCRDLAVIYNANASMANKEIFHSDELPEALPEVACDS